MVKQRLGELCPASLNQQVAEILGVSTAFVSRSLNHVESHLNLTHAERLSAHFGVSVNYILALDLLDQFRTSTDLRAALIDDRPSVRDFLITLYLRRPNVSEGPGTSSELVRVWRTEVNRRLDQLVTSEFIAGTIVDHPKYLTEDHARIIAENFGVSSDWILATDILAAYASAGDLDRALAGADASLRDMLMRLHANLKSESAFVAEWRAEVNRRLAALLPGSPDAKVQSRSGVRVMELARILGTSGAFITNALSRREYNLRYEHGQKLAAHFRLTAEYILAADLTNRFGSSADLERSIKNERQGIRLLMRRLYNRRAEGRYVSSAQVVELVSSHLSATHASTCQAALSQKKTGTR